MDPGFTNFHVCPTYFIQSIGPTSYRSSFKLSPPKPKGAITQCYFANAWVLWTYKYLLEFNGDIKLLGEVASVSLNYEPCPGSEQQTLRRWNSAPDGNAEPTKGLEMCSLCTTTIQTIFPQLTGKLPTVKERYSSTCHGVLLADTGLAALQKERERERESESIRRNYRSSEVPTSGGSITWFSFRGEDRGPEAPEATAVKEEKTKPYKATVEDELPEGSSAKSETAVPDSTPAEPQPEPVHEPVPKMQEATPDSASTVQPQAPKTKSSRSSVFLAAAATGAIALAAVAVAASAAKRQDRRHHPAPVTCPKSITSTQPCYFIPSVPAFTVCSTCYSEAITPAITSGSSIASQFNPAPQHVDGWICNLYSTRMRSLWLNAVQQNDMTKLKVFVEQRTNKFKELSTKIRGLKIRCRCRSSSIVFCSRVRRLRMWGMRRRRRVGE